VILVLRNIRRWILLENSFPVIPNLTEIHTVEEEIWGKQVVANMKSGYLECHEDKEAMADDQLYTSFVMLFVSVPMLHVYAAIIVSNKTAIIIYEHCIGSTTESQ